MAHWIYMNGSAGCIPDNIGQEAKRSEAIEALTENFEDSISGRELKAMRANLRNEGLHYFKRPSSAGAEYCSIDQCNCDDPDSHNAN